MKCASCHTDNAADASFCEQCGSKLELVCPACKAPVSAGARFCKKCGAALGAQGAAAAGKTRAATVRTTDRADPENPEGERKLVTVLFADIKGSIR